MKFQRRRPSNTRIKNAFNKYVILLLLNVSAITLIFFENTLWEKITVTHFFKFPLNMQKFQWQSKEDIQFRQNRIKFETCIERNICINDNITRKYDDIIVYKYYRTDFFSKLHRPVETSSLGNITNPEPVVPRKVHFVLFREEYSEFKFHYLVAIMAAARFIQPAKIYFWYDNLPRGKYWEELKRTVKNIYLVQRKRPNSVYGRPVYFVEHASDITRLEILLEYGGIYLDMDSIVVKPITTFLYYDVTMGEEGTISLCNGVLFSKPWSNFFKIWYRAYKDFNDFEWGAMSVIKPKNLSLIHPNLLHIEKDSLCKPNWEQKAELFSDKKIWRWKQNNFVVHLSMRYAGVKGSSPQSIQGWRCTVGQVMRYIYFSEEPPKKIIVSL